MQLSVWYLGTPGAGGPLVTAGGLVFIGYTLDDTLRAFDLPQIGRAPARFDFAKLENLNGHYIRSTADEALLNAIQCPES